MMKQKILKWTLRTDENRFTALENIAAAIFIVGLILTLSAENMLTVLIFFPFMPVGLVFGYLVEKLEKYREDNQWEQES